MAPYYWSLLAPSDNRPMEGFLLVTPRSSREPRESTVCSPSITSHYKDPRTARKPSKVISKVSPSTIIPKLSVSYTRASLRRCLETSRQKVRYSPLYLLHLPSLPSSDATEGSLHPPHPPLAFQAPVANSKPGEETDEAAGSVPGRLGQS